MDTQALIDEYLEALPLDERLFRSGPSWSRRCSDSRSSAPSELMPEQRKVMIAEFELYSETGDFDPRVEACLPPRLDATVNEAGT